MTEQLKFEVGKHYRTYRGLKATIDLIKPTYMVGTIEGLESENPWIWQYGGGWHPEAVLSEWDLVSEWREPARVRVCMIRHRTRGTIDVCREGAAVLGPWDVLPGVYEIVEGQFAEGGGA